MKVKFVPQGLEFEIKPGESVLHVAQDHGVYVKSVCKGVPSCAECRVRVVEGEHHVLPPGSEELSLIGTGHFIDRRRLSCQLKCFGDITVDMTEQIEKQKNLSSDHKLKSKAQIKDDRVEDQHAIRSSEPDSDDDESKSAAAPVGKASPPRPMQAQSPSQTPANKSARPQGQNQNQRPQNQNQNQNQNQRPQNQRPPQKVAPPKPDSDEDDLEGDDDQGSDESSSQQGDQRGPQTPGAGGGRRRRRRRGRRGGGGGQAPGGPQGSP